MNITSGFVTLNAVAKASLARGVLVSQVRFRRIQSRNPPEPHYDRKAMLEVCQPIIPPKEKVCGMLTRVIQEREPHPWNVLKAKRLRKAFEEAKMILFYHKNSITAMEERLVHNMLFKKDIFLQTAVGNEALRLAVQDSFLANAAPLLISRNAVVVSPHSDIGMVFRLAKKMPQFVLLGGVIDRTFMSRNQLQWLATVPSIGSLHAVTSSLLAAHSQRLYGSLNQHQQRLSRLLAEHSKQGTTQAADGLAESADPER